MPNKRLTLEAGCVRVRADRAPLFFVDTLQCSIRAKSVHVTAQETACFQYSIDTACTYIFARKERLKVEIRRRHFMDILLKSDKEQIAAVGCKGYKSMKKQTGKNHQENSLHIWCHRLTNRRGTYEKSRTTPTSSSHSSTRKTTDCLPLFVTFRYSVFTRTDEF